MKQLRFNHSFINLIALYARICIQWKLLSSWEWWWSIYCSINHFTVLFCRRFSLFLSLSISISPYSLLVPDLLPCKDVWDFFLLFFSTYGHIINEIKDVFKLVWYHFKMRFMATNILLNESLWLLLFWHCVFCSVLFWVKFRFVESASERETPFDWPIFRTDCVCVFYMSVVLRW